MLAALSGRGGEEDRDVVFWWEGGMGITTKNTTLSRRTSLGFCPRRFTAVMIGSAHYISPIIGPDVFMNAGDDKYAPAR